MISIVKHMRQKLLNQLVGCLLGVNFLIIFPILVNQSYAQLGILNTTNFGSLEVKLLYSYLCLFVIYKSQGGVKGP